MKYLFKSVALLTLLTIAGSTFAQKKVFYDQNWKKTKEAKAKFYRVVTPQDGAFYVEDFYKESESLQMTGTFTTKKLKPEDRTGKFTFYYKNGKKSREGEFNGSKPVGEWKYWHLDGSIKRTGQYDEGEMNGEWIGYYKDGRVRSKMTYIDGNKDGKSMFFLENDSIDEVFNFVKGKKHGEFIVNHENGKLKTKGSYDKDSLVGEYENYWENGNISYKGNYVNNKREGECIWYHSNGKASCVAEYKKGKFLRAEYFDEEGEKVNKKIQEKDLVTGAAYPGGPQAMVNAISKQITKKVDVKLATKQKVIFVAIFKLEVDEDGNVKEVDWVLPDADEEDEEYEDEWGFVRNINNAIEGFATFTPREAFNRNVSESITVYYTIDFSKKGLQNLFYF